METCGQTQDQLKGLGETWAASERVGSAASEAQAEKAATLESEVRFVRRCTRYNIATKRSFFMLSGRRFCPPFRQQDGLRCCACMNDNSEHFPR